MIVEYHRPENIEQALSLLARKDPPTLPLGGGTVLSSTRKPEIAVVDLQKLGLNKIEQDGQSMAIGATVTLQALKECEAIPHALFSALEYSLEREASLNIRETATIGGTLASCDGRSPFVTALLALDPRITWAGDDGPQPLGDYLALRDGLEKNRLITVLRIPTNLSLRFAMIARSPMDRPVVCAAIATWPSGRTRVTLGGHGKAPVLAMDGPEPGGAAAAAREAYRHAEDAWASASYRVDIAGTLVQRLLLEGQK